MDNSQNSSKHCRPINIADGAYLFILTAASYAALLAKEVGFARCFNIPPELITTREVNLALAAEAFLYGCLAYIGKVNIVWIFAPRGNNLTQITLRALLGFFLLVGFALYPYFSTGLSIWWLAGAILFYLLFFLGWPIFLNREKIGTEAKLLKQYEADSKYPDLVGAISQRISIQLVVTIGIVTALLVFAYGVGRKEAIEKDTFYFIQGQSNNVVLAIYGDTLVTATADICNRKILPTLTIQKIEQSTSLSLLPVQTGRLDIAPMEHL